MTPALTLPSIVKFRPEIWNSRPLDEEYLRTMFAKKFHYMDENQCRMTLINLLTVLSRYREVLEGDTRDLMRESISGMICALAVNIRMDRDIALLLDTDGRTETRLDTTAGDGMERPISFRQQLSIEVKDATRNIAHFDIVGPALAWAAVQYLAGLQRLEATENNAPSGKHITSTATNTTTSIYSMLEFTVRTELERCRRMGVELEMPRGCLRILEKALPRLGSSGLLPLDAVTLVKTTAVFFRHVQPSRDDPECLMFRRQLERFTRVFIVDGLGSWALVDDITNSQPDRVQWLMESLAEACTATILDADPTLAMALDTLRTFRSAIIDSGLSFARDSHMTYSVYETGMLSYMNANLPSNKVLVDCLRRVKHELDPLCQSDEEVVAANGKPLATTQCDTDTNHDENDCGRNNKNYNSSNSCSVNNCLDIDEIAKTIASLYSTKSKLLIANGTGGSDDADAVDWRFHDFWSECQNSSTLAPVDNSSCSSSGYSKKKRRRNRRR